MKKESVIIIAVIAVLAIILVIKLFTGTAILASPSGCSDSDNGKNYTVYGEVDYKGNLVKDMCLSDGYLYEAYCVYSSTVPAYIPYYTLYKCPTGTICISGVCAQSNQTIKCYKDADCIISPYYWCNGTKPCKLAPLCINPGTINAVCSSKTVCSYCPTGTVCKDGSCVTCSDSDGGKNYYVKGKLRLLHG